MKTHGKSLKLESMQKVTKHMAHILDAKYQKADLQDGKLKLQASQKEAMENLDTFLLKF